jgi:alanyl-tRNA synthetase
MLFKNPKDLLAAVAQLQEDKNTLQKSLERIEAKLLIGIRNELLLNKQEINGVTIITDILEVSNADALRKICTDLKNEISNYLIIIAANIGGKPSVAVCIDEAFADAKNLDAPSIIKNYISSIIQGGGGGQKLFAQAGGTDSSNLDAVLKVAAQLV